MRHPRIVPLFALALFLLESPAFGHDDCEWHNPHDGCGQPGHIHPEDIVPPERVATLLNLSPWQSWVHLYCLEPNDACSVRFECNGKSGEPVSWDVTVPAKTIFSYWPNKTADGRNANLEAALLHAGKSDREARSRTTCEVSSTKDIAVRGYTRFGSETLIPVAVYE